MTRAEVLGVFRLFRERGWLLAVLGVIVASVAFVQLGEWQYGRYQAKAERNHWIEANYAAAPVPLADLLPTPDTPLPADLQWRPVTVTGRYEADSQVLLRNRTLDGDAGFEVLLALRLADGTRLIVDRGWVPLGIDGGLPDAVPPPPAGAVDVVLRLRPLEPPLDRTPPPGQVWRIDPGILDPAAGPVFPAYGVLVTESPAPASAPVPLPHPDEDLGPHLGYAWQWWVFAVAGYLVLAYYMLREARRRAGITEPLRVRMPAVLAGMTRSGRGEPSDEEWEDAADR